MKYARIHVLPGTPPGGVTAGIDWGSADHAVSDPAASLTAEAGIAVFKIAFMQWVYETGPADLLQIIRGSIDELKAVTAGK